MRVLDNQGSTEIIMTRIHCLGIWCMAGHDSCCGGEPVCRTIAYDVRPLRRLLGLGQLLTAADGWCRPAIVGLGGYA